MRKFILPFLITLFALGLGSSSLAASSISITYLPLVDLDRDSWLGPDGGRIVALSVDPANPQIVYAGTWGRGMYKSLDGGVSWSSINTGLGNLYINSLAIDPAFPWVLYAGTYHNQVYKTTDGGQTWSWSGTGIQDQAIVYTIAIDPNETNNIYVGTRGISNNGLPPWNGVVYKSNDTGLTWSAILENVGGAAAQDWVYSLAVNPQASNIIYAATHEHGAYRSTNYGVNWAAISEGISDLSGRAIVVDWQAPSPYTLYMGVWHGDGVFRSDTGGDDWFKTNDGLQGVAIYGMSLDPFHPQEIYLSTFSHGIMHTQDGGIVWFLWGLMQDNIYTIAINPQDTNVLYAGTAGNGLYRSLDGGLDWEHSQTGLRNADTVSVISIGSPDHLFTALYGGGVQESWDGGHSWSEINTGLTDHYVMRLVNDPSNPAILFALTDTGSLFRNDTLSGVGWVYIGEDLPLSSNPDPAYGPADPRASRETLLGDPILFTEEGNTLAQETLLSLVFAPSNPGRVYLSTGGSGVYRSSNGGLDWIEAGLQTYYVPSVAVDPYDSNLIYAVTDASGFIRYSPYGGDSWSHLDLYVPNVFSVAVATDGLGTLYAGTSNGVYAYTPATNWTNIGLGWTYVIVLATDLDHPGLIFAGTYDGAYYSADNGLTWQRGPSALNGLTVQSISFDPLDPHIVYFGTQTRGILKAYIWF